MRNPRNPRQWYLAILAAMMLILTAILNPVTAYAQDDVVEATCNGASIKGIPEKVAVVMAALDCGPAGTTAAPAAAPGDDTVTWDTGTMPAATGSFTQGAWKVTTYERWTESPIVQTWVNRLQDPAPALWKTFPNIPNADVPEFLVKEGPNGPEVPDGLEYGVPNSPFCQQDKKCDLQVSAQSYRYTSGDYIFHSMSCGGNCMLVLVNVWNRAYTFRDQSVDNGFTVPGRYHNGDKLEWGIWGLVSHGAANMLNMETFAHPGEVLNAGTDTSSNAGSNCGYVYGCDWVHIRVIVHAGPAFIALLETDVSRTAAVLPDSSHDVVEADATDESVEPAAEPASAPEATATPAPAVEPTVEDEVEVDVIPITGNVAVPIPADYTVRGDVWFGPCDGSAWNKMLDSNGKTAMAVYFGKPGCAFINGNWTATATNRSYEEIVAELEAEYGKGKVQQGTWN